MIIFKVLSEMILVILVVMFSNLLFLFVKAPNRKNFVTGFIPTLSKWGEIMNWKGKMFEKERRAK